MANDIILPRVDENGDYYISYSQYSSWKDLESFNLKVLGRVEYMAAYFLGDKFPDAGWAQFGSEVEEYICTRGFQEVFTEKEKRIMEQIIPLGNFQVETKLWLLPNVYVKGFIDDSNQSLSHLRDYKTASKNSKAKYYKDEYDQLDIYALFAQQETGKIPDMLEVCIIERVGNCYGMKERRDLLSVGENIWYHKRETSQERLDYIKTNIIKTVNQISDYYKMFLEMQKIN